MRNKVTRGENSDVAMLGRVIVRRARHPAAQTQLRLEAWLLPLLQGHLPVPTPVPQVLELEGETIAAHVAVIGEPVESLASWRQDERDAFARALADFLAALHAHPLDSLTRRDAGRLPAMDDAWWRSFASSVETELALSKDAKDRIRHALELHAQAVPERRATLIHGDFGIGNLLVTRRQLTGIIDFGSACSGDPLWDVAGLAASFGEDFATNVAALAGVEWCPRRARLYRLVFALEEALYGTRNHDPEARVAGIESAERLIRERQLADE